MDKFLQSLLVLFNLSDSPLPLKEPSPAPSSVGRIVVEKSKRRLHLWCGEKVVKTYKVALGKNPIGHKEREGDYRTPEGAYKISGKNPGSQLHKSVRISYSNQQDKLAAQQKSVKPGGDIMIHGLGKEFAAFGKMHRTYDWTQGCIAVTNEEMDEIYQLTKVGTSIEIKP
ncbi:MAG: L,D-transpeptidase family protein [Candidatus Paracaedibacteraceae bacterium]|nr:L,D-transpeptidase family protein [Candidatus Paracaedibacteraceae bacterium]